MPRAMAAGSQTPGISWALRATVTVPNATITLRSRSTTQRESVSKTAWIT